jgi:hypothetical protein
MPPIPTKPVPLAPEPGDLRTYPWRFQLGETAYVKGWPLDSTFTVVGGELWLGFPHLQLVDPAGKLWRIPQLHCSSKPITYR